MKRRRQVRIGTWNTRQLGATQGRHDPHLKFKQLSQIWEHRGWSIVLLSDTKWGRHTEFEIDGHQTTWTIISRGRVSIALNEKWKLAWQRSTTPVRTDGKGAHCRVRMIQTPCFRRLGVAPYERLLSQLQSHTSRNSGTHGGYQQRCQQTYMSIPALDRGGISMPRWVAPTHVNETKWDKRS